MSATLKAVRIVVSTTAQIRAPWTLVCRTARSACRGRDRSALALRPASAVYGPAGPARGLDRLARAGAEAMRVHRQRLGDRALGEHLDRDVLARCQALGLHRLDRDVVA